MRWLVRYHSRLPHSSLVGVCKSSKGGSKSFAALAGRGYHSSTPSTSPSTASPPLQSSQLQNCTSKSLHLSNQSTRRSFTTSQHRTSSKPSSSPTKSQSQPRSQSQSQSQSQSPSLFSRIKSLPLKPSSSLFAKSNLLSSNYATAAISLEQPPVSASPSPPSSSSTSSTNDQAPPTITRPVVAYHLFFLAFLVYSIVVVGGLTRLTESGLSITEWNPGLKGMKFPSGDQEWEEEWRKYRATPEFVLLNNQMSLEDFKTIYMWEWAHRILGRVIGVSFVLPALYFSLRPGLVSNSTRWKLLAISLGIGFQGFLGWYMVKSGLSAPEEIERKELIASGKISTSPMPPVISASHPNSTSSDPRADAIFNGNAASSSSTPAEWTPRVSHFRLAAHMGTAFLVYLGMLHTGLLTVRDYKLALRKGKVNGVSMSTAGGAESVIKALEHPSVRKFSRWTGALAAFVFVTAMSGALVAGLDAGLVYNEFPTMGEGRIAPPMDELMDDRYSREQDKSDKTWRNLTQNPVTVQLIHRTLAVSTLCATLALGFKARKLSKTFSSTSSSSIIKTSTSSAPITLPPLIPRLAYLASACAIGQATLGISTLIYLVPLPLASAHQAGSLALLSSLIALLVALKRPGQAIKIWRERMATKALNKVKNQTLHSSRLVKPSL